MKNKPELSIIIPTYNERQNLPILIEKINNSINNSIKYEIVVVDDNSPDKTWEVALEYSKKGYPVKLILRPRKMGLSSAIIEGFHKSSGEYIVVIDADLQHPPEVIPILYNEAKKHGADIVIASRYIKGGGVEGWSLIRKIISKGASLLAKIALPQVRKISDPMSGFFLVKRDVIEGLELKPKSWKVLLEILVKGKYSKVIEVPYIFRSRIHGESKLRLKDMISYFKHVLELSEYRIIKFAIVGASGVGVNLGVLYLCKELLMIPLTIALIIAFEVSLTSNYILNDLWTFRGKRPKGIRNWLKYWIKYHYAALAGLVAYYSITLILTHLGIYYILAALIGILTGFIFNFILAQHTIWR